MEAVPEIRELAQNNITKNGIRNVDVQWGDAMQAATFAAFDVIVVTGSLESVPQSLQEQLNVAGRLFVVVGSEPVMTAQLITRESELFFNTKKLFETSVPRLSQVAPASTFSL
jgi:protein-L-isoaspartate(D-aspartate) O-methyltransferase